MHSLNKKERYTRPYLSNGDGRGMGVYGHTSGNGRSVPSGTGTGNGAGNSMILEGEDLLIRLAARNLLITPQEKA